MSDTVICIENLGKRYRYGGAAPLSYNLRSDITDWAKGLFRRGRTRHLTLQQVHEQHVADSPDYFWALKDINLQISRGEVVGIIGRNGAGKSTLLKILSRITLPTAGRVEYHGRIASLLEVGTGFHRELTGRENIFLNGSILGMKRAEIARKFDEIVAFAEVEKFIDTPVKFYSSGMYVRLAFAVAAHLEPEILLVDEVLAVGDASFQKKCLGKMGDVAKQGRTILFVSHNMAAISSLCERCVQISDGKVAHDGPTAKTIQSYLELKDISTNGSVQYARREDAPICVREITLVDANGQVTPKVRYQDPFCLRLKIEITTPSPHYYAVVHLLNSRSEVIIFTADDDHQDSQLADAPPGCYEYSASYPARLLKPDSYSFTVKLVENHRYAVLDERVQCLRFDLEDTVSRRAHRQAYRPSAAVAPEIEWTAIHHESTHQESS